MCWRYEWRSDEWTRFPADATTGRNASSTDPETWTAFANALARHDRDDANTDGTGFVVHGEDLVVGEHVLSRREIHR